MIKKFIFLTIGMLIVASSTSYAREIPYTQEDRERLIRVEIKLEEGLKAVNQRIDTMQTFMLWGFGILFGGMGILIGFVIWDRRTALAPAIKKNKELEESKDKIERALKELAKKDPKVAEALKHVGLL